MTDYLITYKLRGIEVTTRISGENILDVINRFYQYFGWEWILKIEVEICD